MYVLSTELSELPRFHLIKLVFGFGVVWNILICEYHKDSTFIFIFTEFSWSTVCSQ